MKKATFYNELTSNKSLLYTIKYEKSHPVIMELIENHIMNAVERGQYIASIDFDLSMLSEYDQKMIPKVLNYYGFDAEWMNNDTVGTLTIHWTM